MRILRLLATTLALLASPLATSSTQTTDITDMWWIPAESGWGVNVTLQNDIAFLTFFVYDETNIPYWFVATVNYQGPSGTDLVWSGDLYTTTGPWFGAPVFDMGAVAKRRAGTATFRLQSVNRAVLSYTVDGVEVPKVVQRQTWKNENYTGSYGGGYSWRLESCVPASMNGVQENIGAMLVTHSGAAFSASLVGTPSCTFTGTYRQSGKLGDVVGTYSCTDGTAGTFDLVEMTPTISGFNGRMSGRDQFCQWSGNFGGILRVP